MGWTMPLAWFAGKRLVGHVDMRDKCRGDNELFISLSSLTRRERVVVFEAKTEKSIFLFEPHRIFQPGGKYV